jgi:hypothetical protein
MSPLSNLNLNHLFMGLDMLVLHVYSISPTQRRGGLGVVGRYFGVGAL